MIQKTFPRIKREPSQRSSLEESWREGDVVGGRMWNHVACLTSTSQFMGRRLWKVTFQGGVQLDICVCVYDVENEGGLCFSSDT